MSKCDGLLYWYFILWHTLTEYFVFGTLFEKNQKYFNYVKYVLSTIERVNYLRYVKYEKNEKNATTD